MAVDFIAASGGRRTNGSRIRYDWSGRFVAASDVLMIVGSSLGCGFAYDTLRDGASTVLSSSAALGFWFAALFVLLMQQRGAYRPIELLRPLHQVSSVLTTWLIATGLFTLIGFALKQSQSVSRLATVLFVVLAFCLVTLSRFYWCRFIGKALERGNFATRPVALVADATGADLGKAVQSLAPFGLSVAARISLPAVGKNDAEGIDAAISEAVSAIRGSQIEEIVVALGDVRFDVVERVCAGLRILPLPIKLVLDNKIGNFVLRPAQRFGADMVAVEMHRAPLTLGERVAKRVIDLTIAIVGLILLAPLLIMTAALIWVDSPGPILFKQTRNGFNNRPFKILKFRSMRVMENGQFVRQASRGDDRVTRVGRWIRKLSVDELPQLWNVLRGEMSIVGPRPHAMAHDEHYERLIGDYPYRQHVKPGLTGWAQVNGSRGETPTTESMAERVRLDLWYVENAGVWLDIRIIARTFVALLDVKHTY